MDYELSAKDWRFKIAERLIALRTHRHMKVAEVARFVRLPPSTYSGYENASTFPSIKRLAIIARFYDCSMDWILLGLGWGGVEVTDIGAAMAEGIRSPFTVTATPARKPGKKLHATLPPVAPKLLMKTPRLVKKAKPKSRKKKPAAVAKATRRKGDRAVFTFD